MIVPEKLKKGETIALLAPASPVQKDVAIYCAKNLEAYGYQVYLYKSCYTNYHGYLAGTDEMRAEELNTAFKNPDIKAIFCIRGGYGSSRLLDKLDYAMIKEHPKVFNGYSDITALHLAFQKFCGFVTYHGPMVESNLLNHFDCYTRQCFEEILNMEESYPFYNPLGEEIEIISEGIAEGTLVGGNLSLFVSLIGTPYMPDLTGSILFLEDIHESVPRINRMLDQLFYTKIIDQISGILFGDFAWVYEKEENFTIKELIKERFNRYQKPVLFGLKCGHCVPTATLPLGMKCSIDTFLKKILFHVS